ncbi:unnamed protein product, partial [Chrysoparadoxa australica]
GTSAVLEVRLTKRLRSMSQFQAHELRQAEASVPQVFQETNLHLFASKGDLAQVKRCIEEMGERVDKRDTRRQTPLHSACEGGSVEVAAYLIENGADAEAKDSGLITPLHQAATAGSVGCIELLIENGAVVDARTDTSDTPLHHACRMGRMDAVKLLLDFGASTTATNKRKQAPGDIIGEGIYVRHDLAKAMKAVMHTAGGAVRNKAAGLEAAKKELEKSNKTLTAQMERLETELETALRDVRTAQEQVTKLEGDNRKLRNQLQMLEGAKSRKSSSCCVIA